jgi:hypothetical protein
LYDNIQRWRGSLAGGSSEEFWDVWRRWGRVFLHLAELPLDLGENELRECATLLIDANVDSPIIGDYRICS